MSRVFVDTSALIALVNSTDLRHRSAVETFSRLIVQRSVLVTTNYVVVEFVSLAQRRYGLQVVRDFVNRILSQLSVAHIEPRIHDVCLEAVVLQSARKGPSMVDMTSFAMIQSLRINNVFAYDGHFEERGYTYAWKE